MPKSTDAAKDANEVWGIVDQAAPRRPPGMVLKVRFPPSSVDTILEAAEIAGLNLDEFARRAVLLVASDQALRGRVVPDDVRADRERLEG